MSLSNFVNFMFRTRDALNVLVNAQKDLAFTMEENPLETALRMRQHGLTNPEESINDLVGTTQQMVRSMFETGNNEQLWKQVGEEEFVTNYVGDNTHLLCGDINKLFHSFISTLPFYDIMYYAYVLHRDCEGDWEDIEQDITESTLFEKIYSEMTIDHLNAWNSSINDDVLAIVVREWSSVNMEKYITEDGKLDLSTPDAVEESFDAITKFLSFTMVNKISSGELQ